MKQQILITGGPVHGYLDSVKIITNTFKGGRIRELADQLLDAMPEAVVMYLCPRHMGFATSGIKNLDRLIIAFHEGFDDYRSQILKYAPTMDAVILGAAVANLIPQYPFTGKFKSHDYKPGDVVNIPFVITPRVIDEVRTLAPKTKLFGFKLLDDVSEAELAHAGREVMRGSRANFVFANDRKDLNNRLVITPEGGSFWLKPSLAGFIAERMRDQYFKTEHIGSEGNNNVWANADAWDYAIKLTKHPLAEFTQGQGHVHGAVAVRQLDGSKTFVCSARAKTKPEELVTVDHVLPREHRVVVRGIAGGRKASLAAPLFERLFYNQPMAQAIIHAHREDSTLPLLPYAPPGSVADARREVDTSFRIEGHGAFYLIGADKEVIR